MLKSFVVRVGITWGAFLLAGVLIATAVATFSSMRSESIVSLFSFAVTIAFLAATFASIVVMMPTTTTVRALLGASRERRRAITRAVNGRDAASELDPELRSPAVAYANVLQDYIPMQLIQNGSLYFGLILTQVVNITNGNSGISGWNVAIIIALVAVFAVFAPVMLHRRANARLFARENQQAPIPA